MVTVENVDQNQSQGLISQQSEGIMKSSVHVVSKNGYLFKKKQNYVQSKSGDIKIDKAATVKRIKHTIKPYNRFGHFKGLPQYSMNQPCINIASPYIGSEI